MARNPNYGGFTQVYSFITDRTELLCICFDIDRKNYNVA